jgi:ribosomal protein L29
MGKKTLNVLKAKPMNEMSSDELRTIIKDARLQNMTLNAQVKSQKKAIEHPSRIKENRRMIARAMTILVKRGERCV